MCATTDGFKIAEKDMEIRGPGDIAGTRQSGMLDFKIADLIRDRQWLDLAAKMANQLLDNDPELNLSQNRMLKNHLLLQDGKTQWSKIS